MGVEKRLLLWMIYHIGQSRLIPDPQPDHDNRSKQRSKGKPGNGVLAKGQDDDGCQQWSYCRTAIAAHLEDGLCQSFLSS